MSRHPTADDLHPELRRVFRFMPSPPIGSPFALGLLQRLGGLARTPRVPPGMQYRCIDLRDPDEATASDGATDRSTDGAVDRVAAHVYAPAGDATRAALVWIHGGGMVLGSAAQDQRRCFGLARHHDLVVVSVDYRLAPQHPFPAALDDCHRVWRWVLDHATELGVDPGRVAVGGESAGGGLAAGLAQRLHDEGGTQPAAQWLFCPMLDDRTAADTGLDGARHALWANRSNRAAWTAYLGGPPAAAGVPPYAAPARRADLTGLPPAWIGCGDIELFFAEDRLYAQRLEAAGVPCELDVVPGAPHAFESIVPRARVSRDYTARAESWLVGHLS